MRRALKNFICVLVLLTLFACSTEYATENPKDGVLTPVKQNERNTQIISSLGFDTLLMYDLELKNEDIKMIHLWIEHYKNGEKQEDLLKGATGTSEKMTVAASKLDFKIDDSTTYSRWTYSVADGTAISTLESLPIELYKENLGMGQTWVDDTIKLEAEKPFTLALIARYDGNGVRIGLEDEVIINTIKDSDEVFVVKAMISKKEEYQ
ncbi:hypothetical protein E1I69_01145 [Bacillus timonensis]|uniref:Lipoprotein n=1 Tax=Bacillus timonensis TaxID=1033734 RepID=A0A4S3PZT0_9BACI|nr:hypothetical protein [Bacillus timonensis]THE15490.1 hypothetical protein E1I69_01145 [Bacillus timonensis]